MSRPSRTAPASPPNSAPHSAPRPSPGWECGSRTDPATPPSSVIIENVSPRLDCGRYPVKREVGDRFVVAADIFKDGHNKLAAVLRYQTREEAGWHEAEMRFVDNDRWSGAFDLTENTRYRYAIQAFPDAFATWRDGLEKKFAAGQEVGLKLREGKLILAGALPRADGVDRATLEAAIAAIDGGADQGAKVAALLGEAVVDAMRRCRSRAGAAESPILEVVVDRVRARYAAWYSMFPRSAGTVPGRSATFAEAAERLPAIAAMGFDTVYLLPIHPIGTTFRKGPNNTLGGGPDDPGVPYAIGGPEGGHRAIEPGLGTLEDFRAFVRRTEELGMEVALDVAIQASPDHPWVSAHPEWFTVRPDGSIQYAENPPKKYQDIYPLSFDTDPEGLAAEILRIVRHWMAHGVRIFRVDNPHTKPVQFWEWLLAEVRRTDPDVLFLAEAFTRPAMMHTLAKIGFQQSYTYFTWRNDKAELEEYLRELSGPAADYMRPNFFVNTQDILHAYLQYGGPPAFKVRAVLAATLSPTWGVYSGYELCERTPLRAGSEEYLDSEKYQYRPRDWSRPEQTLAPYITALNRLRREHRSLQRLRNLRLHSADSNSVMTYSKRDGDDTVLVVVNLDPHTTREATVHLDLPALGRDWGDHFAVHDEVTGTDYVWGRRNYVRLDPQVEPAHIFTLPRTAR